MTKKNEASEILSLTCGLVMPISAIDGCGAEHWAEVKNLICDAIGDIDSFTFVPKLVSEQDDVGVIQKRIVQNLYSSDVVICDVSCKNANVMFELGMRLAFDKPTILIKDDKTDFAFDTGVIEHLVYPRDLRFSRIVAFKKALADKVAATYKASVDDPNHSTFLKNFGSFKVASVTETVGTADQVMVGMMQELTQEVARLGRRVSTRYYAPAETMPLEGVDPESVQGIVDAITSFKELHPSSNATSFIGNDNFYSYLSSSLKLSRKFKTYASFVRAVDEFLSVNTHLLK